MWNYIAYKKHSHTENGKTKLSDKFTAPSFATCVCVFHMHCWKFASFTIFAIVWIRNAIVDKAKEKLAPKRAKAREKKLIFGLDEEWFSSIAVVLNMNFPAKWFSIVVSCYVCFSQLNYKAVTVQQNRRRFLLYVCVWNSKIRPLSRNASEKTLVFAIFISFAAATTAAPTTIAMNT